MNLQERITSFALLGEVLRNDLNGKTGIHSEKLNEIILSQHLHNEWFTPDNVKASLLAIAEELTDEVLTRWTDSYPALRNEIKPSRVGIIMAGNIPLVGFFDFLSVLISGNNLVAKTSSKDSGLILYLSEILCKLNPEFSEKIEFTAGTLSNFDVVIATGSNNSSRYFEYYFRDYPHIIRKNRTSIAVLDGTESDRELEELGKDIFSYFGLGCRNVSKIFVPKDYDISLLSPNWEEYSSVINHRKYGNNYDFNKAVYIVNKEKFFDTGSLLIKEDLRLTSPVGVLYFQYYDSEANLRKVFEDLKNEIQCIVGKNHTPFGKAQSPHPWDYSDGIDTIDFLLKKNHATIS